ncbi:MAG: phosphatase PAP2 family protein [Xanthobacteraceae bacterium]|nr:MAG: phosphatase PAP2 family protein [Xanthobacteraceae bacterium]
MNRLGLTIALTCAALFGLLLGLYPALDLKIAGLFYASEAARFPATNAGWTPLVRHGAMAAIWALAIAAALALILKLLRPNRRMLMPARAAVLVLATVIVVPGVLSNLVFKNHWGRPRPTDVVEFHGELPFVAWWDRRGACPENCSFFSGEASAAFSTYALAALTPPPWRPAAYAAASLFGFGIGLLRMAFGGHFLSDVIAAGVVAFVVVWLAHGLIYRWPRTRLTDAGVEAALERLARRLSRRPPGGAAS